MEKTKIELFDWQASIHISLRAEAEIFTSARIVLTSRILSVRDLVQNDQDAIVLVIGAHLGDFASTFRRFLNTLRLCGPVKTNFRPNTIKSHGSQIEYVIGQTAIAK
jgi:hypothetical protein